MKLGEWVGGLAGIRKELHRMADLLEAGLAKDGVYLHGEAEKASEELGPDETYTDELVDYAREVADTLGEKVDAAEVMPWEKPPFDSSKFTGEGGKL